MLLSQNHQLSEDINCLARGPIEAVTRYKKYLINGFRFQTKEIEMKRKTQNSGIIVTAQTQSFNGGRGTGPVISDTTFYGVLIDIIELSYIFELKVVLFKCEWVSRSGIKRDKDCTLVNFSRLMNDNDPFILASQAEQVMYLQDQKSKDWKVVIKINPRDFYDMNAESPVDDVETLLQSGAFDSQAGRDNDGFNLVRSDMPSTTVEAPLPEPEGDDVNEDGDEDEYLDLLN